jgi:phage terminase small subunit
MAAHGPLSAVVLGRETRRPRQNAKLAQVPDAPLRTEHTSAPASLGEVGQRGWADALASAPWLTTPADLALLLIFCELLDEQTLLRGVLARGHRTVKGSRDQRVDSPVVGQLRAVESQILKFANTLGLGPMNRGRLGVALSPRPAPALVTDEDAARVRAALAANR